MHNLSPKKIKKKKASRILDKRRNAQLYRKLQKARLLKRRAQRNREQGFFKHYLRKKNRACGGENPIDYDEERPSQTGEMRDKNE